MSNTICHIDRNINFYKSKYIIVVGTFVTFKTIGIIVRDYQQNKTNLEIQ